MRIFRNGNREMRARLSISGLRFYVHTHHGEHTSVVKFHSSSGAWQFLRREAEGWRMISAIPRFFGAIVIRWLVKATRAA